MQQIINNNCWVNNKKSLLDFDKIENKVRFNYYACKQSVPKQNEKKTFVTFVTRLCGYVRCDVFRFVITNMACVCFEW